MSRAQSLRKPLIALLLGLSLIAAACGSSEDADGVDTPSPGDEATSSTEANEPDTAGDYDHDATLRVAYLFVPTTLDPHMKRHIGDRPGLLPIWDTLLTLDDNRNVAPWLATEWDFDEAGTLLTFTLRDDVVFHDGSPADAYAAAASINRLLDLEDATPSLKAQLADVTSVEAVDETTLEISLDSANEGVLYAFASTAGAVINPEYLDGDLTTPPAEASSGPYVAVEFTPNEFVRYERAEQVWHEGTGRVAELTLRSFTDTQAGINALETGEVDVAFARVDEALIDTVLGRNPDFQFHSTPAGPGAFIALRNTRPPLDQVEVRAAIMHAIDRASVAEHGVGRFCTPADQWVPEGISGYIDGYDPFPFEPETARELLADLSPGDLQLGLLTAPDQPSLDRSAQIIQQMLGDVGVEVEIIPGAFAEVPALWSEGGHDMVLTSSSGSGDTPTLLHSLLFGSMNLAGPEADELLPIIEAALPPGPDRVERTEAAHKAAMESGLYMPFCWQTTRWMGTGDVIGVDSIPQTWTGIGDLRFLAVR